MTDQSVFSQNQEAPQVTPENQPTLNNSELANQLASIKNENGEPKYKSVEDALKGAAHAQDYISELKGKLSQYETDLQSTQAELAKRESVEDVVSRLTAKPDEGTQETPAPQSLDEQSLAKLIEQQLTQRDAMSKAQQNKALVDKALQEQFGDKARELVASKASELGLSVEKIGALSEESPQAVLALFGAAQSSQQGVKPNVGGYNLPPATQENVLEKPSKSMLSGATARDQAEYFKKVRDHVYKKNGITT